MDLMNLTIEQSRQKVTAWLNSQNITSPIELLRDDHGQNSIFPQHSADFEIPKERKEYVQHWLEHLHDVKPIPVYEDLDSENSVKTNTSSNVHSPRYNQLYTTKERDAIIKYITENDALRFTSGNILWKIMAMDNVCNRSWESMRSYFFRKLYSLVRNHFEQRGINFNHSRAKSHLLRPGDRGWNKFTRYYSISEDLEIIHYLLEKKKLPFVIGNKIWMDMESEEIVLGRSWKSLKIRFLRYILNNLGNYYLTKKEYKLLSKIRKAVNSISKNILSTKILRSPRNAMSTRFSETIKFHLKREAIRTAKYLAKHMPSSNKSARNHDTQPMSSEKQSGGNYKDIDMVSVTSSDGTSLCRASCHSLGEEGNDTRVERTHGNEKNNRSSLSISKQNGSKQSPNFSHFKSCDSGFASNSYSGKNVLLNDHRRKNENIPTLPLSMTSLQADLVNKHIEISSNDGNSSIYSLRHHHYQLNESYENTPESTNVNQLHIQSPKISNNNSTCLSSIPINKEHTSISREVLNANIDTSKLAVDFDFTSSNFNQSQETYVHNRTDNNFDLCDDVLSNKRIENFCNGNRVQNCNSIDKGSNSVRYSTADRISENEFAYSSLTNHEINNKVQNIKIVSNSLASDGDYNDNLKEKQKPLSRKNTPVIKNGISNKDDETHTKETRAFHSTKETSYLHLHGNGETQSVESHESEYSNDLDHTNDDDCGNYFGLLNQVFLENLSLKVLKNLEKENEKHIYLGSSEKHELNKNSQQIPNYEENLFSPIFESQYENYLTCDSYETSSPEISKSSVEHDGSILNSSSTFHTCSSNFSEICKDTESSPFRVVNKECCHSKPESLNCSSTGQIKNCENSFPRNLSLQDSSFSIVSDRTIRQCYDMSDITINSLSRIQTSENLSERSIPETPDTYVLRRSSSDNSSEDRFKVTIKVDEHSKRKLLTHINHPGLGDETNSVISKSPLNEILVNTANENKCCSYIHDNDSSNDHENCSIHSQSTVLHVSVSEKESLTYVPGKRYCERHIPEVHSQELMTDNYPNVNTHFMDEISSLKSATPRDLDDCNTICHCNSAGKQCYQCNCLDYLSPSSN